MKILIVEDEKQLREVISESLLKERYVVETADTAAAAFDKITAYDYDCILLDIMLPDGSGLDLLRKLKEMGKRENVIIVAAKDAIEDNFDGLNLGADDYLAKPFSHGELLMKVDSLIRRYRVYKSNVTGKQLNTDVELD